MQGQSNTELERPSSVVANSIGTVPPACASGRALDHSQPAERESEPVIVPLVGTRQQNSFPGKGLAS